jgi:hypothetical protein
MKPPTLVLRVSLELLATEAGGRKLPIRPGYRPDWDIANLKDGEVALNGAAVESLRSSPLHPGASSEAWLRPAVPRYWANTQIGQRLPMHEGKRIVGYATVLEMYHDGGPGGAPTPASGSR